MRVVTVELLGPGMLVTKRSMSVSNQASPPEASPVARPGDEDVIARVQILTPISVVVPTFREAENIPALIKRLAALRVEHGVQLELLIMDDDSRDGSTEAVEVSGQDWVRIVVRRTDRGLSAAVVDGFRLARYPIIVCMDADLSHPPEKIPELLLALASGQDFALGSRYVSGGATHDDWGIFRWLNSRVATLLARPLTNARDPMAGFFAMRKRDFERATDLRPIGYKIALEFMVKCGLENIGEIPIHFAQRTRGQSKLTLGEQLKYLQHLRRLYAYKFGRATFFSRFLVVGAFGTLVNLSVLTALLSGGAPVWLGLAGGVVMSALTNLWINRRFALGDANEGNAQKRLAGLVAASVVGLGAQYAVAWLLVSSYWHDVRLGPQLAALCGIAAGMSFNFLGNRFLAFKRRYTAVSHREVEGRRFSTAPGPTQNSVTASQSAVDGASASNEPASGPE